MTDSQTAGPEQRRDRSALPAILGWGGLALFTVLFAWVIINQLQSAEEWADRGPEAVALVRNFTPSGQTETLDDLIKGYSLKAKDKGGYVGEFTWNATQKDGSEYEVTLLWKEGNDHKVAVWRVDLQQKDIRPQGDAAASLPQRAHDGAIEG